MENKYDVIVVGAGHAGCEAAHSAARMGSKVLLVTMNLTTIAQMSCNPAMGGIAKGQIVREIDALGGMSGIVTDQSAIQFRMLNRSKGPAMWSPRTQNDRLLFSVKWRELLEKNENIDFLQDMVVDLTVSRGTVTGVITSLGDTIYAQSVILTSGTFLNGLIHIGRKNFGGGRAGERASKGITERLEDLGFESGRMKTGTPPRVDGRSLNYDVMEIQYGDENPGKFSYSDETHSLTEQRTCHITYTNGIVHDILREGFDDSPMFNGAIQGVGPRYCPSIEDKINRFAERDRHQIFVEPEGWNTVEVYVNGFSTSLPHKIQERAIRNIKGFENAKIFRPGYAIEYDYFPPTQLKYTLETKLIENLFFAGQINGTTGYEEAACQGLIAGINAHNKVHNKDPFTLTRSEAYIGVLIDDLINKGTEEPYRMFTSRAEFRILLRQDNADVRLSEKGYQLGLLPEYRYQSTLIKIDSISNTIDDLKKTKIAPELINDYLVNAGTQPIKEKISLYNLAKRPQLNTRDLVHNVHLELSSVAVLDEVDIEIKYENYIEKEKQTAEKMNQLATYSIPSDFDYDRVKALSAEGLEKLKKIRPETIGAATSISGVSPSDISILVVYLGK